MELVGHKMGCGERDEKSKCRVAPVHKSLCFMYLDAMLQSPLQEKVFANFASSQMDWGTLV